MQSWILMSRTGQMITPSGLSGYRSFAGFQWFLSTASIQTYICKSPGAVPGKENSQQDAARYPGNPSRVFSFPCILILESSSLCLPRRLTNSAILFDTFYMTLCKRTSERLWEKKEEKSRLESNSHLFRDASHCA